MEVNPPSVGHTSKNVAGSHGDTLVRSCCPSEGRRLFPTHTPQYNKLIGGVRAAIDPIHLRNIRVGMHAIADRWHIGKVVRFAIRTYVHNFKGRKSNANGSIVRSRGGHHEGRNCFAPGCDYYPSLPQCCRIVYIDIRKLRWCSVDSVAFHSFKWPKDVRKAKSIVNTLFANHCGWADVLIVRGCRFGFHSSHFRANRVLEHLFWNSYELKQPYVVYREDCEVNHKRDIVPRWLLGEYVHANFCQCHVVGPHPRGWHRPGTLYSNFVDDLSRSYKEPCGCYVLGWQDLVGCIKNTMNSEVAIKLSWAAMNVLYDAPPSVPFRGEPLVCLLASVEQSWERALFRSTRTRHREWMRSEEWSEEGGESEEYGEGDDEESSKEESIA